MRLFVAVWPPDDVVERLASLPLDRSDGRLRWTRREQWHVTMRFLGWVPEPEAALQAFRSIDARIDVGATLGPTLGRFSHRVLHVPVAGLEELAARVAAATASVGEPPEPRSFHGHITLARAKRPGCDLRPMCDVEFGGSWLVRELTLVSSRPGRAGSTYEVVERLAVGAPAG